LDADSDAPDARPFEMECRDEYDDTKVNFYFICFVAFFAFAPPGHDLSQLWVVDSACSINLTAFRSDFETCDSPYGTSRVGGVGVDVRGSGKVAIAIPLVSGQVIHRIVHALYIPLTCLRALHSALPASPVSNGCNPAPAVNFFPE
jgi:hypothetical protein